MLRFYCAAYSGLTVRHAPVFANAQAFASMNNGYLVNYGINAVVTGINVNMGKHTQVQVSANLDRLFPSIVPEIIVSERGFAEIRAFTR